MPLISRHVPARREIILITGLALFLNLIPGTVLQSFHLRWGLVLSQALFIAGPVLCGIRWFHLDRRTLLPLHRPRGVLLSAALLGALALNHLLSVAGAWHGHLFPPPEAYSLFFKDLFIYRGRFDFSVLLIVFAVVPAVCEEILFRGFLLQGLIASLGHPTRAIMIQALVFALFHVDPWRGPEVFALGVFLALLTLWSGSLIPAMVAHAFNNALSISLSAAGYSETFVARGIRMWTVPFAVLLLAGALLVVHRAGAGRPRERVL